MLPELAIPPATEPLLRSDDLDEIRERLSAFGEHEREVRGRGPLGWEIRVAAAARIRFGWTTTRLRQIIRATPSHFLLHLPLDTRIAYHTNNRELSATPDCGVLLPSGRPYMSIFEACMAFAIAIPEELVHRELSLRDNRECDVGLLYPLEFPLVALRRERIGSIASELVAETTAAGDTAESTTRRALIEARVVGWAADLLTSELADRGGHDPGLRRIRKAEEWIDENLARPITLGDLCDVAGLRARSLQIGFLRHRGLTPMQFVTNRRLLRARLLLGRAQAPTTITEIALACGFSHLGRFSALYRSAYGTTPSATLTIDGKASPRRATSMKDPR